jgi:hypothetical protein
VIILRTHPDFLAKVVERSMHALASGPKISPSDLILISQTVAHTDDGLPPIRYVMEFEKLRADRTGEISRAIWGRSWPYVLYGKNCRPLARPFSMSDIQVSNQNYGQGGPYVYVASQDEAIVRELGLLS